MHDLDVRRRVKTRKDHVCWWCGGGIPAGEEVVKFAAVVDTFGGFVHGYACGICPATRDYLANTPPRRGKR